MDDAAYGNQTVTLTNNITGSRKTLYEYSGVGGGSPMDLSFSRDGKSVVFQPVTGWDFGSYNGKYNYRAYDLATNTYQDILPEGNYTFSVLTSSDGSKIRWTAYDEYGSRSAGVFYFPSIAQFSLPYVYGAKISYAGTGSVIVGDTVFLRLTLKGIETATAAQKITLTLNTGGTATYDASASQPGKFFVFKYVVRPDDTTKDLAISSINLNGAQLLGRDGQSAFISDDLKTISGTLKINGYIGTAASEYFAGTLGAETLQGKGGDDLYRVNNSGDVVLEAVGGGTDTVVSTISYALAAKQEIEILRVAKSEGSAHINLTGNDFNQAVEGNSGNNILDGRGGVDTMRGYRGNDTYVVDHARDFVREIKGQGFDKVVSSTNYTLGAGQEIEALQLLASTGSRAHNLTGNEFGQALVGNAGANVLDGKGGKDVLHGGKGADAFVFSTALTPGNVDRIVDFSHADDTIRLAKSVFAALAPGQLADSAFKNISTGAADANDRILYKQTTGELFYDADGSGAGAAVKFAVLDNHAKIAANDFLIV